MDLQGISYTRAYYTGMSIVHPNSPLRYEVKDPPCSGEQGALLLEPNDQGKRKKSSMLTLFCPFTLQANLISDTAGEISQVGEITKTTKIEGAKEPKVEVVKAAVRRPSEPLDEERVERLSAKIQENWRMRCRLGLPFAMDVAALVLTRLGKPVPEERPSVKLDAATGEVKKSGKDAGPELVKAVSADSKPGRVLKFFMESRRSITEAMAEFGATRSSIQSNLYGLWSNNGIGYVLAADMVDIVLPQGCEDPFAEPAKAGKEKPVTTKKARGKPMQDEMLITALPEKGKRREVALATCKGFTPIADVAKKLECSEGSVKSHLNDLHIKHGYGFEISEDGAQARLIVPKGWKP